MRYNRFEIRRRPGIKIPAISIEMASDGDLFYSKILHDTKTIDKNLVIIESSKNKVEGFIREDHPWFNIDLIKRDKNFRMRSHAKMITYFLQEILGKDFSKIYTI